MFNRNKAALASLAFSLAAEATLSLSYTELYEVAILITCMATKSKLVVTFHYIGG